MSLHAFPRADQDWVDGLRRDPPEAAVVADLRDFLRRGLARALASRGPIDDADLEDFAQDAVIRILDRLDSYRGDSRFTTWALAVAVRVAYTALRRRRWGDRSLDDLGLAPDAPIGDTDDGPLQDAARRDLLAVLRWAIDRDLTPRQRTMILAELSGMPVGIIADQLQTNPNALYKLYHDARKKLRASLERAGFSESEVRAMLQGAST